MGPIDFPLTAFTLFPSLPVELRLKVWSYCYAIQPPRFVTVRTLPHSCADDHHGSTWCPRFSACAAPTLLHISSEARMAAREEALRAGHLCFGTPPTVFFNPGIDRLYLPLEGQQVYDPRGQGMLRRGYRGPNRGTTRSLRRLVESSETPDSEAATMLGQFKKSHQPAEVRFLAVDSENGLQMPLVHPVMVVMRDFPKVKDLVFVIKEHKHAYEQSIAMLAKTKEMVDREKVNWDLARLGGGVNWEWPVVRLAMICKGQLKFIELDVH